MQSGHVFRNVAGVCSLESMLNGYSSARMRSRLGSGERHENAEELRYDSDYRLGGASQEQAEAVLDAAEEFVAAIRAMFS